MKSRSLVCLLPLCILAITIWNSGCGTSSTLHNPPPNPVTAGSNASQALYVSTANGIAGFGVNSFDGSLSPLAGSPFASSLRATSLVPNPSAPFILAQDVSSGFWTLRVNSQGALETSSNLPFPMSPQGPLSLGVSASGKTVFFANYMGALAVSAHSFDVSSGSISASPSSQVQFPVACTDPTLCSQQVAIMGDSTAASSEYLWVQYTSCGFHEDCDNPLEPVAVSNSGATLAANPIGSTNTSASFISGTSFFAGGAIVVQNMTCCSLISIGSYDLQNGQLINAAGCPAETSACSNAWSVAIHPNRNFVVFGTMDNQLLTATRDSNGNLSMPKATNISLAIRPEKLLFDQAGQHLYVLGSQNLIFGFSVDASTRTLMPIAGSPWSVPAYAASTGIIFQLPASP